MARVAIEVEEKAIRCGRVEWQRRTIDTGRSEHDSLKRCRRLAADPEVRFVRLLVTDETGHVSRYTIKGRFPVIRKDADL